MGGRSGGSRRKVFWLAGVAGGVIAGAIGFGASPAVAQSATLSFHIAAEPLDQALTDFARQANVDVIASSESTRGKTSPGVNGARTPRQALAEILAGSGLASEETPSGGLKIVKDKANPPGPGAQSEPVTDLGEIIVTAQKRSERLENVPVSITVLKAQTLERAGIHSFGDLGQLVAGAQVSRGGLNSQPSIRGVSTLTTGPGFENNVAVYIDGFYQNDTVTINSELVNLSSVQVLKGPQGTLYGRNAMGGALVFETLAPSEKFVANGQVSYGRFNDRRLQGYISGPIDEKLGFSLAAYYRHSDGYIHDIDGSDSAPLNNLSIRTKLKFTPTDNLAVTLGYNHIFVSDNRSLDYIISDHAVPSLGPCGPRACSRDTASPNSGPGGAPVVSTTMDDFTGTIRLETDVGTLTSYTGYASRTPRNIFDSDGSRLPIIYIATPSDPPHDKLFQQTVDFNVTAFKNLSIIVGGQYFRDRTPNYFDQYSNNVLFLHSFTHLRSDALAAYVDGTLTLGDRWFLTGGLRYSNELKGISFFQIPGTAPSVVIPADKEARFTGVTPRANLRYAIGDRTSVYLSYSEGFRSGTFNPTPVVNPALVIPTRPEKVRSYELGFKTATSKVHFDTSVYSYQFQDLQVGATVPNPLNPGTLIVLITNAKRAVGYGADAQLSYTPAEGLNLRAAVAYTHARYTDFKNGTGFGLNNATNLDISNQVQDWSGQQMARAPTWTGNAGFDYTHNLAGGKLLMAGNVSYSDSYVIRDPSLYGPLASPALANTQRYRTGPFAIVNLRVNWTAPSGHYTIGAYADNITNTRYLMVYQGTAFGDFKQYSDPATYGVQVGFSY